MESHGKVLLRWQGNLLVALPKGPFNEEGGLKAINKLQQTVINKNAEYWLRLELWQDDALGSPEVMADAMKSFQWGTDRGCRAIAVVVANSLQRQILEKAQPENTKIFDNRKKALLWLEQYKN
jgi:hypothetical protein